MKNKKSWVLLALCILSLVACSGTSEKSEPTHNVAGQEDHESRST